MAAAQKSSKSSKKLTHEQIFATFQEMRQKQRTLANKASELEMDRRDHELVKEVLRDVDGERRCYRMIGGILVERKVKEVLPSLELNFDQLSSIIKSLDKQIEEAGKEINEFKEKHGIRIRGEDDEEDANSANASGSGGILVQNKQGKD